MKQVLQPFSQHKIGIILAGFFILGVGTMGLGLSPSSPECPSNVMGLSCSECVESNAASSGVGMSISGCLPFPFAIQIYDNYNQITLIAGFVIVFMSSVAGVKLSPFGQGDQRYR